MVVVSIRCRQEDNVSPEMVVYRLCEWLHENSEVLTKEDFKLTAKWEDGFQLHVSRANGQMFQITGSKPLPDPKAGGGRFQTIWEKGQKPKPNTSAAH